MAVYKLISSKALIAEIYEDFNPNHSGWTGRAVRWFGKGLQLLKIHSGYETVAECVKITDYKGLLPCNLKTLLMVTDTNGNRIYLSEGFNHKNVDIESIVTVNNNDDLGLAVDSDVTGNVDNAFSTINETTTTTSYLSDSYSINPDFIHTPFKSGTLILYYKRLPIDEEGFPKIPDDAYVKEYLMWFVLDKLMTRGMKHQIINYNITQAKLERLLPQARNSAKYPSIENMELYKQQYETIISHTGFTDYAIPGKPRL